jgi:hypothetical protein
VPSLTRALEAGKPITVQSGPTLADGLLVPRVGTNAFALCQRYVDKARPARGRGGGEGAALAHSHLTDTRAPLV